MFCLNAGQAVNDLNIYLLQIYILKTDNSEYECKSPSNSFIDWHLNTILT